nr:MAG TPA: Protein of unknown function (DUF2577) [Caudoviricetes sp.]
MSYDINAINFVKAIRMITNQPKRNNMLFGEVVSVEPLKIDIGNDVVLTKKFLYLGQMCRPHKVKIPHTHILDTHFTENSPSIGSVGAGLVVGKAYEVAQSSLAASTMNPYTTLDDEGEEVQHSISDKDLGRGSISTSISVSGQATVIDDSVTIKDNKHKHIIDRQITKDVHFPKSDYEESVTIEIEPKLQVGDIVLMFAMNDFQMYYVAERVEKAEQTS